MSGAPNRIQTMRPLKRFVLAPFPRIVQPWATRPPASRLKAIALRRLVITKLLADARPFRVELDDGRVFFGNTGDLIALYIYLFRTWEPNLTAFISARLERGDVCIDVGAQLGWFTTLAGSLLRHDGVVVSVEASPFLESRLRQNVEANGLTNVRIINAAAAESRGTVDIVHGPAENTGLTRIRAGSSVRCDTLQALVGTADFRRARLIKIDVEGSEYGVVRGLAPALSELPETAEIVVEVGPKRAESTQEVKQLFETFESSGFVPYVLPNNYAPKNYMLDTTPSDLARLTQLPTGETDVVFSKTDDDTLPLRP